MKDVYSSFLKVCRISGAVRRVRCAARVAAFGVIVLGGLVVARAEVPAGRDAASSSAGVLGRVGALPDAVVDQALDSLWTLIPGADRKTPSAARRSALVGYLAGHLPGVEFLPEPTLRQDSPANVNSVGFYAEVLPEKIGYLRLGTLAESLPGQLDAALTDWMRMGVDRVVVDLRSSGRGGSLALAAQVAGRFCPKQAPLFSVQKGGGASVPREDWINEWASPWAVGVKAGGVRLVVALVGRQTAGAAEAVAVVLRNRAHAILVGHPTRGEAADFAEVSLPGHGLLRVPTAEPVWMDVPGREGRAQSLLGSPVQPDLLPADSPAEGDAVVEAEIRQEKISPFLAEVERSRMSEAALVAGRNPELEETLRRSQNKGGAGGSRKYPVDSALRVAVDFFRAWPVLHSP